MNPCSYAERAKLMIQYLQQIDRQRVVLLALFISLAGFFLSRVLISIGMILLVANAVLHPQFQRNLRAFLSSPLYGSITIVFLIVLISGLYSSDLEYWLARLRTKIPFLVLPLAFAFIRPFSKRMFYIALYAFFGIMVLSTLSVIAIYLGNIEEISKSYKMANVIPTPFHHIRYSIMLAFCIAIGLHCYIKKITLFIKSEPIILLGFSIFLFLFLHLMAVRSGILAAYIVLFVFAIYLMLSSKRYILGGLFLGMLIALPILAYWTMPTLQNKIKYMFYDLQQYYYHDKVENLSDSRRIHSIQMGIKAGWQQPLIGVGYGDMKSQVQKMYQREMPKLPEEDMMIPHNQFVIVFAGTGIIGLGLFLWAILFPVLTNRHYRDPLFLSFNLIVLSSFMTEPVLEVQLGTGFYLLLLLFLLKQPAFGKKDEGKEESPIT